jgi:outer membrane receptor for ferrienterochelin and colicins
MSSSENITTTACLVARTAGLWLIACVASTNPAFAGGGTAGSSGRDLTDLSFDELASVKVATVYGASKHDQLETEAPSSVSVVTADDIKQSGYRTLADIINGVRGFYATSDRSYSYLGLRGFNRPGDYGGRILITVDGHRLNDAIFDQAGVGTEGLLDVDLIERIEVIRGPGSSLYGNNAFFGVINIITRRGRDFDGVEASGAYASYDTYSGRVSYGKRFEDGLELALSGTYLDSEGHDRLFFPEFVRFNRGQAEHSDGSYAGNAFASISYRDFSLEGGFVQRQKMLPTAAYFAVFNDRRNEILDERAFADLKFQHQFEQDWALSARLYYDHYRYEATIPLPEFPYEDPLYPGLITLNRDLTGQESLGYEFQVAKTFFDQHRLTVGVEHRHDFSLDQLNYDDGAVGAHVNARLTADTVGVYAQDEYSILPNLILNAGVRYDYFSSFGNTINPRAALIYSPLTNSTFKAIFGQAFRAPSAYELYYEAPGYSSNPDLKPETIRSYELVYEQGLVQHLRLTASAFYNDIDDLITFQTDTTGTETFGNLAGATSLGGEIGLDAAWAGGWHARASYTYADTRDSDSHQRLSNSPQHVAKLNVTAPLWSDKIFANLEVLGLSDRLTVQNRSASGYATANVTLLAREIVKGLELSASVYNVFDYRYQDPVSSDFFQDKIEQEGRTFRVKLTYRF